MMLKVPYGQDPYNVIGQYIQNHITAIEDMIAVIQVNEVIMNELYMVDMNADGYFYWKSDWWEGEEKVALLDYFPVSEAERMGWTPCSERLPEEGERVLATHLGGINPNNQVIEHIYQHGKFTCGWDMDMNVDSPTFGQRYMGDVIAWMPLPEPYGGNNDE